MCVSEEEPSPSTAGSGSVGSIEEIVVTADRLGIDVDTFNLIEWDEVAKNAFYGTVGGSLSGNIWAALGAGLAAGATTAESQEDVDLEDLFVIKNDMIMIEGAPSPYLYLY